MTCLLELVDEWTPLNVHRIFMISSIPPVQASRNPLAKALVVYGWLHIITNRRSIRIQDFERTQEIYDKHDISN